MNTPESTVTPTGVKVCQVEAVQTRARLIIIGAGILRGNQALTPEMIFLLLPVLAELNLQGALNTIYWQV